MDVINATDGRRQSLNVSSRLRHRRDRHIHARMVTLSYRCALFGSDA
jgi:hypothetical protein